MPAITFDKQAIFDKVTTHLLKQNEKAYEHSIRQDAPSGCRYRTHDGKQCAVGCLIPNDLYDPSWENNTVATLVFKGHIHRLFGRELDAKELEFLRRLQGIHDSYDVATWPKKLTELSIHYDLTLPPCLK